MSFHEVAIAIRAENRASPAFRGLALDVANLGAAFGVLSNEQVKAVSTMFTVIRVVQSLNAITHAGIASTIANTLATIKQTVAQHAAAVATWLHASGQLTLVAALTLGIGAIIAVTAALWAMAAAHRAAAAGVGQLSAAMASASYGYGGNISRLGEEALRRRGTE